MGRRRLGFGAAVLVLLLVVALAFVIAACGSGGTTTTSAGSSTTGTPGTTAGTTGSSTESTTASTTGATDTLKFGASVPLSGPPSAAGISLKKGFDLATEDINAAGGIKVGDKTYKVEFLTEDSKATAEGATTAATKLCLQDGVKFVMGDIADFMAGPIYDVTSKAGALFFFTLPINAKDIPGNIAEVGTDKPLYIRAMPAASELDILPAQYLAKTYPAAKKVALVALSFPDYDSYKDVLTTKWAPLGLSITTYERVAPDAVDFVPTVSRVLASKPDAVDLMRVGLSQFPLMIKTLRDQGFKGPIMYATPTDISYAALAGANTTDVFGTGLAMDDPNLPAATKDVDTRGRAKYGKDWTADCLLSYDQTMLLAQMIEKAQSIDPATVVKVFETLTKPGDLKSIYGDAFAAGLKTTGVNHVLDKPWPMSRMVDGKGELIGFYTVDIP